MYWSHGDILFIYLFFGVLTFHFSKEVQDLEVCDLNLGRSSVHCGGVQAGEEAFNITQKGLELKSLCRAPCNDEASSLPSTYLYLLDASDVGCWLVSTSRMFIWSWCSLLRTEREPCLQTILGRQT